MARPDEIGWQSGSLTRCSRLCRLLLAVRDAQFSFGPLRPFLADLRFSSLILGVDSTQVFGPSHPPSFVSTPGSVPSLFPLPSSTIASSATFLFRTDCYAPSIHPIVTITTSNLLLNAAVTLSCQHRDADLLLQSTTCSIQSITPSPSQSTV